MKHEESILFMGFGQKPQSKHLYSLQAPGALGFCQPAQQMPQKILGLKCQKASSVSTNSSKMGQLHPVLAHKAKQLHLCSRPALLYPFSIQQIFWEEFYGGININNCFQLFFKTSYWRCPFHGIQSSGLFSN